MDGSRRISEDEPQPNTKKIEDGEAYGASLLDLVQVGDEVDGGGSPRQIIAALWRVGYGSEEGGWRRGGATLGGGCGAAMMARGAVVVLLAV